MIERLSRCDLKRFVLLLSTPVVLLGASELADAQTAATPIKPATPIRSSATLRAAIPAQGTTQAQKLVGPGGIVVGPQGTVQLPDGTVVEVPAEGAVVADPAEQLKQQRLAKIKAVRIDRRPSAILAAWAEPPEAEKTDEPQETSATETEANGSSETPTEGAAAEGTETPELDPNQLELEQLDRELKAFARAVALDDWDAVQKYLSEGLELEEAQELYNQMTLQLGRNPDAVPTDLPPEIQQQIRQLKQMQAQQRRNQPETNAIDWNLVVELIRVAPQELDEDQFRSLGRLLVLGRQQGHAIKDLLARMEACTAGQVELPRPLTRRQVAILFTAGGLAIEAGDFLESLEQLTAAGDLQGLNLRTDHLLAKYGKEKDRAMLEQAWGATQAVLGMTTDAEETDEKEKALRRAVDLASQVEETLGLAWLEESFQGDAIRGKEILASIGGGAARGLASQANNPTARLKTLELQKTAVDALLDAAPEKAKEWESVLSLLATIWLREANASYRFDQSTSIGPRMQRDVYGNIFYLDSGSPMPRNNGQGIAAIKTGKLLELRPGDAWVAMVEPSLLAEFKNLTAKLFLKVGEENEALPYIESLAAENPRVGQQLVDEFLRVWTKNHDPNSAQNRTSSYLYVYGFSQQAQSIPLTRSKQQRNLEELAELVRRLREMPVELDESLMRNAFTTCHSKAEVFRLEAIEEVFGQLDSIEPKTLASLAQVMRSNLGGLWREPATQETAKTKRRKKDIQAEVLRGYETAEQVLVSSLEKFPEDWSLRLALASIAHDENNYQREIAPNSKFVGQQQDAFVDFAAAAELYIGQVESAAEEDYSVEPFQLWFYASLGAVDLRQIDTEKRPDLTQPEKIKNALMKMPKAIADKHLAMFANDLFTRMSAVSPGAKFRYLRGGFEIVGEHEQAKKAKEVFEYYNDLVTEIELQTQIDGDDVVGHKKPFGVFVNLRHTVEIERESGGFARYLQNQNTGTNYYYNYGRPTEDYRDKFEEMVRGALSEQFEVLSVTFQSEDVNSRATEIDGWRYTPYAYLLLKARGPEVDKLPPVRLDLDFMDTSGYVVLPIESSLLPLVASREPDELRPIDQIIVTQTLDERQADEGKLVLEVKATGTGLIPNLDELLDVESPGFKVESVEDQGLSVTRFDPESEENAVNSERLWLVNYTPAVSAQKMPKEYSFGETVLDTQETVFQRYNDADLVTVAQVIDLEEQYGKQSYWWLIGLVGVVGIAGCCAIGFIIFMPKRTVALTQESIQVPDNLTPFSVLALLEEIGQRSRFDEAAQRELSDAMNRLEESYFGDANGEARPDLQVVAKEWLTRYSRQ